MLISPKDMKFVSKRWGHEIWITNNEQYCGKILFIRHGHHLSYHFHPVKDEVLYVLSGKIDMTMEDDKAEAWTFTMPQGYACRVFPGTPHQMYALEDTTLLEFSTQHFDEDSIRQTTDVVFGLRTTLEHVNEKLASRPRESN